MEFDDQDYPYYDDEEEADRGVESEDDESSLERNKPYTVMEESDIRQCQEHEISHLCSIIPCLSKSEASLLLCHYNWEGSKVVEEWFADEERVRSAVGLSQISSNKLTDQPKESTCGICFDEFSEIYPVRCGHKYCLECWEGYIMNSINEGAGCLWLRCPGPSCRSAVDRDMVEKLASEEGIRKYSRYFLRSYVENARKKKKVKWCTAPGCENAVKLNSGCSGGGYDVFCACSHGFCWNCAEDAHRPVDCETVAKWVLKNSSEAENTEWILANSKPCPECKRPIEKNHGCMHMTCTPPCNHQFCWLCLGDWSKHGAKTGGNYACNKYEGEKRKGIHDELERKRKCARTSLRKYTHYYERWANNHKSRLKAVEDFNRMRSNELKKLSEKVEEDVTNLEFVVEGWRQIIECRRVLTWSYTYGYYLPEHEHGKIQLFECLQGQAENSLERLHSCAEKELKEKFIVSKGKLPEEADFTTFREKLTRLTKVTGTYFENLVRALENGLSEVDSESFRKSKTDDKIGANNVRGLNDLEYWYCDRCTYANPLAVSSCHICLHPRHGNRFTMDEDD